jgi:hypothetical protein
VVAVEGRTVRRSRVSSVPVLGLDLQGDEGDRDLAVVEALDDPFARNDVVVEGVERSGHAILKPAFDPFPAADAEVRGPLDQPPSRGPVKPAPFGGSRTPA